MGIGWGGENGEEGQEGRAVEWPHKQLQSFQGGQGPPSRVQGCSQVGAQAVCLRSWAACRSYTLSSLIAIIMHTLLALEMELAGRSAMRSLKQQMHCAAGGESRGMPSLYTSWRLAWRHTPLAA